MYRNEPTGVLRAHLFDDDDVQDANGDTGTPDEPVPSRCSFTDSYGPFIPIDEDDLADPPDDLCGRCVLIWESETDGVAGNGVADDDGDADADADAGTTAGGDE